MRACVCVCEPVRVIGGFDWYRKSNEFNQWEGTNRRRGLEVDYNCALKEKLIPHEQFGAKNKLILGRKVGVIKFYLSQVVFVADLCSNYYLASRLPYAMYANRSC